METESLVNQKAINSIENLQPEIQRVFKLQKEFHRHGNPIGIEERKALLKSFRETMLKYNAEVKQALYDDMGRPTNEETSFEVMVTVKDIDEALENIEEWAKPVHIEPVSDKQAKAYIHYDPKGVVLLMGAWNFPFSLVTTPLVAIIAAGNSVIIKTTETTPASSKVLKKIISEAFDEKYVYAFEGNTDVTTELQKLAVDHVFFTGSPRIGKTVMAAASANLSSVTLELGGKNPALVDETADLDLAAKHIVTSRFFNGGQTCLCIDYICVPKSKAEELTAQLIKHIKTEYYDGDKFVSARTSRMVNKKNFDRVTSYLYNARELGATFSFGGGQDAEKLMIEPTVLSDVPADALIMKEEIFGPVIVICPYDNIQEAYNYMDTLGKPLGMYIYSTADDFVQDVLNHSSSGIVCVNGWLEGWMDSSLPFGGVGTSGMGAYHGIRGFKEVSHQRAVYENPVA